MTAPATEGESRPVPSAVLSWKIDNLAGEVLELRRELRGLVSRELYDEGRRADQRRIEQNETALRELVASLHARRDLDERERASRRWQLALAVLAAVVSVALAISGKI
jgi:hypothetical protein